MNTMLEAHSTREATQASTQRVDSIDIFRGLTMAVMIFVNALSDIRGLPWWTYHAPARVDVMTYVDMVFPFFLFAVGMSLPLSVAQRLKRDASIARLWGHILLRFVGLIVLGLILANAEKADPAKMPMSGSTWALLGLISAALYLAVYGKSESAQIYSRVFRALGLTGIVILFALFRRTTDAGQVAWLDPSYPEILGLIGYSYLAVAILYIPTRRWAWAPAAWFVLLVSLCALSTAKVLDFPERLPLYFWPFGNGAMACIVTAGVITSSIFLRPERRLTLRANVLVAAGFAFVALFAGRILTPLGISKIRATPTWSLYSIGASVLLITLLYWICDVKRHISWTFFVASAGSNTLLTYLLPDIWYFLLSAIGFTYLDTHLTVGWPGVMKTVAFTLLMLALSSALTKARVRLQL